MIFCANNLCIYWRDNHCLSKDLDLDHNGTCIDCIRVTFFTEELEALRAQQYSQIEELENRCAHEHL